MKIAIDMQCCQTEARSRGIGRYSLSFLKEVVKRGKRHDFVFMLNYHYLGTSATLISEIEKIGKLGNVLLYDYPSVQYEWHERLLREQIADLLRSDRIETCSPDIYHVSSLFEGESVYGPSAAFIDLPKRPVVRSATIYDLIPALYPDKYLTHWPEAFWYRRTLAVVRQLDVALAISGTTKKDIERVLHLDPKKIVNISGAVDDCFRIMSASEAYAGAIWDRLNREHPYLLYIGGPDFRKNLYGMLEAFSLATRDFTTPYQLVIVYDGQGEELRKLHERASELGIARRVVTTGYVSDEELVQLYNACTLLVFPSLYEGLGLPIIEAMRCGAPAIVSDNSSLAEIVSEPRYRFDAANPASIAEAMSRALTQPGELDRMRIYSRERGTRFTWEESALCALQAWEEAFETCRKSDTRAIARLPRIAMFTPLPPAKSGVADYSAEFLESLRDYASFDIFVEDVSQVTVRFDSISIWHHAKFPYKVDEYDAVVYQIGNSPYHHYMLPYVQKYYGIVVVHDAYLGHLSHDPGNPEPFIRQVIRDHGGRGRAIVLHSDDMRSAARKLIDKLSCSPTHVHRSLGIIVHSQFARDILVAHSRSGIAPQITVIPQYCGAISPDRKIDKASARRRLGLPVDALIVGSCGHVASSKGVLELIEAFALSQISKLEDSLLIFVGELEGGPDMTTPFARQVLQTIEGRSSIKITGFVDQSDYDLYIAAIDFGIQLRTVTRGETSRAVLNLLMNGVPFIFNRFGALRELPSDVALGLDSFDPKLVASAMDVFGADRQLRQNYADAALKYSKEALDPKRIAADFVKSVLSMTARAKACGPKMLAENIAQVLRDSPLSRSFVDEIAASYVCQEHSELGPRLLIDVTHIRERDLKTGVQRVVRELTRAAYSSSDSELRPQTFAFTQSGLILADDYAQDCGARAPVEAPDVRVGAMDLRPFDKLLMADGSWHLSEWMHEPVDRLNAVGGSIFGLVHDLLPLRHPSLFRDHVVTSVNKWFSLLLEKGTGMICTSQTSADELINHIRTSDRKVRSGLRIGYARLGCDFSSTIPENTVMPSVLANLFEREELFVMVGTMEPRKGHGYVLDAFEQLWDAGSEATLAFAGKLGWGTEALELRIQKHPERNKRFFFLGFVPEVGIRELYKRATAVIVASIAEGFGLPIYEAAYFGTPLMLTDLAVFRELAGPHARYFSAGSASSLVDLVRLSIANGPLGSAGISPPSWRHCFERVLKFMKGENTYHRF
jgi:glycosyltransferase involved in cell wall biosynthesis